jgi:hypothetical protein
MSPRLQALKYIIDKSYEHVDMLRVYMDDTKYLLVDHDKALALLSLAKEVIQEAMLP